MTLFLPSCDGFILLPPDSASPCRNLSDPKSIKICRPSIREAARQGPPYSKVSEESGQ